MLAVSGAIRTELARQVSDFKPEPQFLRVRIPEQRIPTRREKSCLIRLAAAKLVWINKGSHERRRDFRQIHRLAPEHDRRQIFKLSQKLGLNALLDEVLNESDEIQ